MRSKGSRRIRLTATVALVAVDREMPSSDNSAANTSGIFGSSSIKSTRDAGKFIQGECVSYRTHNAIRLSIEQIRHQTALKANLIFSPQVTSRFNSIIQCLRPDSDRK